MRNTLRPGFHSDKNCNQSDISLTSEPRTQHLLTLTILVHLGKKSVDAGELYHLCPVPRVSVIYL
jgi:hypothetical protein